MGTWGHTPFENDTAADWLIDVEKGRRGVRATLEDALVAEEPLRAWMADEALAACALVAGALNGEPHPFGQRPTTDRVAGEARACRDLAARCIPRIAASESADLWEGDRDYWRSLVEIARSVGVESVPGAPSDLGPAPVREVPEDDGKWFDALRPGLVEAVEKGDRPRAERIYRELLAQYVEHHGSPEAKADAAHIDGIRNSKEDLLAKSAPDFWELQPARRGQLVAMVLRQMASAR